MSSQELTGESGDCGQRSSDSEAEDHSSALIQHEPKQLDKCFDSWRFKDTVQADISNIDFNERKQQLIEHFQTRTTPKRPASVKSLVIFANLHDYINAEPEEIPTVSIEIIGYVQTKRSRNFTMTHWIPSATWEPVPGGLCSSSGFQADMDRANNEKSPWFRLPIFGELRLNNLGRLEARRERKVSAPSFSALHIFSDFHSAFLVSNMFLCRGWRKPTGPNKKLGKRPSAPETQPRPGGRGTAAPSPDPAVSGLAFVCTKKLGVE